jgi:hypothetical protein
MSIDRELIQLSQLSREVVQELQAADFLENQHVREASGRFATMKAGVANKLGEIEKKLGLKTQPQKDSIAEKVEQLKAIAPQVIAGLAVLGTGAIAVKSLGKKKLSKIKQKSTKAAASVSRVPSAVPPGNVDRDKLLLSTRGFNWGFAFPIKPNGVDVQNKGGKPLDWLSTHEAASSQDAVETQTSNGVIRTISGLVGVAKTKIETPFLQVEFNDPLGRKDRSGRVIPHTVTLIGDQVESLKDLKPEDLVSKIWTEIADDYAAIYKKK